MLCGASRTKSLYCVLKDKPAPPNFHVLCFNQGIIFLVHNLYERLYLPVYRQPEKTPTYSGPFSFRFFFFLKTNFDLNAVENLNARHPVIFPIKTKCHFRFKDSCKYSSFWHRFPFLEWQSPHLRSDDARGQDCGWRLWVGLFRTVNAH